MLTRAITKEDFDQIVSVIDQWWGGPTSTQAHPLFFYELGDDALIVEEDGEMVGFLLGFITTRPPRTGYIHLVGIHPRWRRRGVARELYEAFIKRASGLGAQRIKAITNPGNQESVAFHEA